MNPFKKNNQILPVASINSVYVENTKANDLFSPSKIVQTIKENSQKLNINDSVSDVEIFKQFNQRLISENATIQKKANEIATLYGKRLADIICTLKKPSEQSKKMRTNWTENHWEYWKNISSITFVGGLTSAILTNKFLEIINAQLNQKNISDLKVSFIEGSANLGTYGLSTLVENGEYLLFDFGQTYIKRAHHIKENKQVKINTNLESIPSDYLFYKFRDDQELLIIAKSLHNFILETIIDTMNEVCFEGSNILISIANYVRDGVINQSRGGYGKLALLSPNYQLLLQEDLSQRMQKKVQVSLYHDTTAMSLGLQEDRKGAIISLGTAFGVAFIE